MDDLAHPQAEAEVLADDLSTPGVESEADTKTDEQDLYPEDQDGDAQIDEDEGGADDEPEEEIAAPVGLKAEEKDQFAQLPKEAQRVMSDILQRREVDAQKGVQSALTAQREAERTAADRVAQTQQQFAAQAAALVQAFQPEPPPIELARQNPAEYQYQKAIYDEQLGTYQELVGQIAGIHTQSEQHQGAQRQAWMQEQVNQLRSIPEIADDTTRPEFLRSLTELGQEIGYTPEELAQVSAKDVKALHKVRGWKSDAEKWRQHKAKRNERPRAAAGRFAAAPAGNGAPVRGSGVNTALQALYPND